LKEEVVFEGGLLSPVVDAPDAKKTNHESGDVLVGIFESAAVQESKEEIC